MNVRSSVRTGRNGALPAELTGMVPRDVRFTASGIVVVALVCMLILGALTSAVLLSIQVARARQPRERVSTLAQTVAIQLRRGEHPRRTIRYQFDVNGRGFTGSMTLPERDRRNVLEGAPLAVEYVASDPAMNWIAGYEPRPVPAWLIPIISGALLAAAGAIAWGVRRDWVLLSEGRSVLGRVIAQKKVRRGEHTAHQVTCTFEDFSGAIRTMRYDVGKAPPAPGAPIAIVYHRDNPRWSHVYPLTFVRPARARST